MKKRIVISAFILLVLIAGSIALIQSNTDTQQTTKSAASTASSKKPSDITKSLQKYDNKDIELRGVIIRGQDGAYYLMDYKSSGAAAIRLDFTKSGIDPEKYNTTVKPDSAQSGGEVKTTPIAPTTTTASSEEPKPPTQIPQAPQSQKLKSTEKFPEQKDSTTSTTTTQSPEVIIKGKVNKTGTPANYFIVISSVKSVN